MLVIREEIPWHEKKERSELAAESTFCYEFSAASQSSSNQGRRQVGSGMIGVAICLVMEELKGYLALHVSFAHITPCCPHPGFNTGIGTRTCRTSGSRAKGTWATAPAKTSSTSHAGTAWSANQIDERLKRFVIEQLGVDESEVVRSVSLVEDLNADSLDLVEYIMSVEEVFKLQVSDEDAEKLTTVGETQADLQDKGVL